MAKVNESNAHDEVAAAKVAALDAYLAELEAKLGPISEREAADAEVWAHRFDEAPS